MDDVDDRIAALQLQLGRLQSEVMALRISGSYVAHALTAALVKRSLVTPQEIAAILEIYAEGFEQTGAANKNGEMSAIRAEVAETLKRQAAEVEKVVAMFEAPRPN